VEPRPSLFLIDCKLVVLDFEPKKILVGVDGSEYSIKAMRLGVSFAKKYGARLYIVHVIDFPGFLAFSDPSMSRTVESTINSLRSKAEKKAEELLSNVSSLALSENIELEAKVIDGSSSVAGSITEYAADNKIDLIVVGNRGLGGFKRILVGSVSQQILNHAHCSVLVLK
jgi:nucleotide-binding universal stress UspA family protein